MSPFKLGPSIVLGLFALIWVGLVAVHEVRRSRLGAR